MKAKTITKLIFLSTVTFATLTHGGKKGETSQETENKKDKLLIYIERGKINTDFIDALIDIFKDFNEIFPDFPSDYNNFKERIVSLIKFEKKDSDKDGLQNVTTNERISMISFVHDIWLPYVTYFRSLLDKEHSVVNNENIKLMANETLESKLKKNHIKPTQIYYDLCNELKNLHELMCMASKSFEIYQNYQNKHKGAAADQTFSIWKSSLFNTGFKTQIMNKCKSLAKQISGEKNNYNKFKCKFILIAFQLLIEDKIEFGLYFQHIIIKCMIFNIKENLKESLFFLRNFYSLPTHIRPTLLFSLTKAINEAKEDESNSTACKAFCTINLSEINTVDGVKSKKSANSFWTNPDVFFRNEDKNKRKENDKKIEQVIKELGEKLYVASGNIDTQVDLFLDILKIFKNGIQIKTLVNYAGNSQPAAIFIIKKVIIKKFFIDNKGKSETLFDLINLFSNVKNSLYRIAYNFSFKDNDELLRNLYIYKYCNKIQVKTIKHIEIFNKSISYIIANYDQIKDEFKELVFHDKTIFPEKEKLNEELNFFSKRLIESKELTKASMDRMVCEKTKQKNSKAEDQATLCPKAELLSAIDKLFPKVENSLTGADKNKKSKNKKSKKRKKKKKKK